MNQERQAEKQEEEKQEEEKQEEKQEEEKPKRKRGKALNKKNEEHDITLLLNTINDPLKGETLRTSFQSSFPEWEVMGARQSDPTGKEKAGSRGTHYDFQIHVRHPITHPQGTWWKVEHKGSQSYHPIDASLPPWTGGVQFFNGGMEKYRITMKYAIQWYEMYIASGYLTREYDLSAYPIPTLEEWIKQDAKVQGDPKTPFGKALKLSVRKRGLSSLLALRDEFVKAFVDRLTEQDECELAEDILPIIQSSFQQKDVWLQVAGNVSSGIYHTRWSPALRIQCIRRVRFVQKKDVMVELDTDCAHPIQCILRWGKGAGFSNLRLDIK